MSSDTSELTFIRCPSCRSLVPAVSRRCRMCGFSLAPQETDEEADMEERRASRVRQRTASTKDPATSVVQARQDLPATSQRNEGVSNGRFEEPRASVSVQEANPLEDYLTFEDEPQRAEPMLPDEPEVQENLSMEESVAEHEDVAVSVRGSSDPSAAEAPQRRPGLFRVGGDRDKNSPLSRSDTRPDPNGTARSGSQQGSTGMEAVPEAQPVTAEEPQAKQSQRMVPGASFANASSQQYVESPSYQEKPMETRTASEVGKSPTAAEQRPARQSSQSSHSAKPSRDDFERPRSESAQRQVEQKRQKTSQAAAAEGVPRTGRIFGWFVSYDSPDGKSHDIREGKYFLSFSKIKDSDFVVNNPSVSTPHAMLAVTPKGFSVQDLMSEKGVFLKKRGTSEWVREEEVVRVEHGDWLRFGDVEYLVCLVAYPGAK
jgi:FHA domain